MPHDSSSPPAAAHPPPVGYLSFTLHAHLPYVVNHGTWPHGIEWLHEATAETYLPLLRVLRRLQHDGIALRCNLNLSPILLEQLAHPVFLADFPRYVTRKIVAAREDEAFFAQSGEPHYAQTARFWHHFYTLALQDFEACDRNLAHAFRDLEQHGQLEIITCAATHAYLPLLGTDQSVRAQIRTAVATHTRHFGIRPRGIWSPECGYRPAGLWQQSIPNADGTPTPPASPRIGVEQAFAESSLRFFTVDTHLVEDSPAVPSSSVSSASRYTTRGLQPPPSAPPAGHSLYQPYLVAPTVSIFPRDPRTGLQVWSGETGYPGDGNYLDFHKKRWPSGHRYWRVTGPQVDLGDKAPYFPEDAAARIQEHATHFLQLVHTALAEARALQANTAPNTTPAPPILTAPFDAELFGHWWFEGPLWLEAVARTLHASPNGVECITASAYLERHPPTQTLALAEGSWGAEGTSQVWLNPETAWTYGQLYPLELHTRTICSSPLWAASPLATRIVKQLCRELLLLQSSDWQFLITTGAARDYAELRFTTHHDQWQELGRHWSHFTAHQHLTPDQQTRLEAIEQRDSIFADIDPTLWASEPT